MAIKLIVRDVTGTVYTTPGSEIPENTLSALSNALFKDLTHLRISNPEVDEYPSGKKYFMPGDVYLNPANIVSIYFSEE